MVVMTAPSTLLTASDKDQNNDDEEQNHDKDLKDYKHYIAACLTKALFYDRLTFMIAERAYLMARSAWETL